MRLKIINRLKVLRAEENLTQEELAGRVGVSRVTINCIERGVYYPTLELGLKLARFFKKPVEEIFIVEGGRNEENSKESA